MGKMNLVRAIPTVTGFEEALKHFTEEGVLVDAMGSKRVHYYV